MTDCADCGHPAHLHADLGPCLMYAPWFGLFVGLGDGWTRYGHCPCRKGALDIAPREQTVDDVNRSTSDYYRWWDHPQGRLAGVSFAVWRIDQADRDREATLAFQKELGRGHA